MSAKVAMCPDCKEPLVTTLAFTHKEFVCVCCGRLFDWLQPDAAAETPELLARYEELKEQWRPIGSALLGGGVMLRDCAVCADLHEPHLQHATAKEIAAHEAALEEFRALGGEPA